MQYEVGRVLFFGFRSYAELVRTQDFYDIDCRKLYHCIDLCHGNRMKHTKKLPLF